MCFSDSNSVCTLTQGQSEISEMVRISSSSHLPVGFIHRGVGSTAQPLGEQKVRELRRGKARGHVSPARDIKHHLNGNS